MILAFDTSAAHCAAVLLSKERILAFAYEEMTRGQAERLMLMLEEVLSDANAIWNNLSAIGVGVGPGNFTGIRLAVSAARGLSMSLGIPAFGINKFAAIAFDHTDPVLAVTPAPRDQLYVQAPDSLPEIVSPDQALAFNLPLARLDKPIELVTNIAHLAALNQGTSPPAPLYIRAADAAPSRITPPRILENDA